MKCNECGQEKPLRLERSEAKRVKQSIYTDKLKSELRELRKKERRAASLIAHYTPCRTAPRVPHEHTMKPPGG